MVRLNSASRLFWLVRAIACLLSLGWLAPAAAQVPSAEQIEVFQSLPPEQQQQILDSMNRGGTTGTASGSRPRADRQLKFPETVRPRKPGEEADEDTDDQLQVGGVPKEPRF